MRAFTGLFRSLAISLVSFSLTLPSLPAQESSAPFDPKAILKELEQLRDTRSNEFKHGLRQQIEALTAAAATKQAAANLYEDAVQATQFEGKPKDSGEFADWLAKNKELLLDDDFRIGLQLHMRYLVLTLRRLSEETVAALLPDLLDYTAQLAAHNSSLLKREKPRNEVLDRIEKARPKEKQGGKVDKSVLEAAKNLFNKSLAESAFVRWYRLEGHIASVKNWELISSNIEGIVDKTLLPHFRENKNPQLLALWDQKLARAEEQAKKNELAMEIDKFQNQTGPALLWSKAKDRLILGQTALAAQEMLALIKAHPSHADFDKWIEELRALLEKQ